MAADAGREAMAGARKLDSAPIGQKVVVVSYREKLITELRGDSELSFQSLTRRPRQFPNGVVA
jgi:hypothetical protein